MKKNGAIKAGIPEITNNGDTIEAPKPKTVKRKTNGKSNPFLHEHIEFAERLEDRELLRVLSEVRNGNFSMRMPMDRIGVSGKICDTLNDIISLNETLMHELTLARNTIGKQGRLNHRVELPRSARGSWSAGVDSINSLISDLVHPTIEIAHVISSVAKGNLSQEMPLKIGDHLLQGEFARIATEVNDMVKQLNLFSMEVTRVAREVGSEGKLGGQAKVKGVAGVWKDLTDSVNQSVELYQKNHQLQIHERKLLTINKSLEKEIERRRISEDKVTSLNKQLIENNTHLKMVNEELDRFAYVASHDLQEPLRKIMVFSDKILREGQVDKASDQYFQKIIGASQRMQSLINDLLTFSRHSVNSDDFKKVDLAVLAHEAMHELELEIEKTGAKIEVHGLPVIMVIPSMIRQLFYNLINNALKFKKKDRFPHIQIHGKKIKASSLSSKMMSGKGFYQITITDDGIGFDPKYAEEIFVVFKRLHSYHEFQGSGVGLSICKKIMEKHNGYITAESDIDRGSKFIIVFPEKP